LYEARGDQEAAAGMYRRVKELWREGDEGLRRAGEE
jgi:hypothetical protein